MSTNTESKKIIPEHVDYKRCDEVDFDIVHRAFSAGFSDYMIKAEFSKEVFLKLFFGPEGNRLDTSLIAVHEGIPIGVVLGGIKYYEGIKTMRCGALAVSPGYRGKDVSKKLYDLHKDEAIQHNCQQLFLEVILGNDRAINFYKKLGYEKIYDLSYYSLSKISSLKDYHFSSNAIVKNITIANFESAIVKWDYHINWQNDLDYIKKGDNYHFYGAYFGNKLIGSLCINATGKISFLYVEKNQRCKGIGSELLKNAIIEHELKNLNISFPNNSSLEGFIKKIGFERNKLSQYEMYLTL
ncbi:GNAT family N-acetyltransferase [Bacillus sp. RG28]|uniref:GNAT family N-acetyltransferase n=1 Tax=Gottfriedia endophytica TaxID=2820819 RepID=A0A940NLY9_9BACI|nr:GNAT family N-acetyltransferase [Gottfriedia endophytica]MBP0726702.1 GNAT family N-acetyltransferase [Gottfriedia endophytica]